MFNNSFDLLNHASPTHAGHSNDYWMRTYTAGCYYLNAKQDEWVSDGLKTLSSTREVTVCGATHLTSFATGFFPEVNSIDFEFVFTAGDFEDNVTVYMFLDIALICYICWMIWAIFKDRQDEKKVSGRLGKKSRECSKQH